MSRFRTVLGLRVSIIFFFFFLGDRGINAGLRAVIGTVAITTPGKTEDRRKDASGYLVTVAVCTEVSSVSCLELGGGCYQEC